MTELELQMGTELRVEAQVDVLAQAQAAGALDAFFPSPCAEIRRREPREPERRVARGERDA